MNNIFVGGSSSCSIKHFLIDCIEQRTKIDNSEIFDYLYFEKSPDIEEFEGRKLIDIAELTTDIQHKLINKITGFLVETELTTINVDIKDNVEGMNNMHLIYIIEAFEILKKNGFRPLMACCHFKDDIYCTIVVLLDDKQNNDIKKTLELL